MSEKLNAAFTLLNNANNEMARAFKVLAQAIEYQRQAFELLNVKSTLEALPVIAEPLPTATPQAGEGVVIEVALWKRDKLTGVVTVRQNNAEIAKARCVLFNSNPNDRGMVFNGGIVPLERGEGSFRDNQIGALFINTAPGGKFTISGRFDESPANYKVQFSGELAAVENRANDNYPHMRAVCHTGVEFVKTHLPTPELPGVPKDPEIMQQLVSDNVMSGLMSGPGAPADPIMSTPTMDILPGAPAANSELLVDAEVDDIRNLLG